MKGEPKLRSVGTNLTAGAANTVYTCPANHTVKVELLFVASNTSGNKTVSIKWHDTSAGTNYFIVGGYTISAYNFLKIDGSYLVLNAGDYLVITPEAGSTMDATISVEEYFDPMNKI
tara:strand:+ start:2996 stop:3346 length:351 start_codon:yes stop_codon:yes gene_type:complete